MILSVFCTEYSRNIYYAEAFAAVIYLLLHPAINFLRVVGLLAHDRPFKFQGDICLIQVGKYLAISRYIIGTSLETRPKRLAQGKLVSFSAGKCFSSFPYHQLAMHQVRFPALLEVSIIQTANGKQKGASIPLNRF